MPIPPSCARPIELSDIVVDAGESAFIVGDEVLGIVPPHLVTSTRGALAQFVLIKVGYNISHSHVNRFWHQADD